jgi:hypothetical protein
VEAVASGASRREAAELFEIAASTAVKCKRPTIHVCHIIVADDMFAL